MLVVYKIQNSVLGMVCQYLRTNISDKQDTKNKK